MSALREAVLLQMRLRGFATNTVDAYIHAMVELWKFFKRPLEGLTCEEVQRFLDEIITVRKRAWATVNVYFSAYRFLYEQVLKRPAQAFSIPPRGRSGTRPGVLSRPEVERLIDAPRSLKHRALLALTYGSGLRVSEVVRVRIATPTKSRSATAASRPSPPLRQAQGRRPQSPTPGVTGRITTSRSSKPFPSRSSPAASSPISSRTASTKSATSAGWPPPTAKRSSPSSAKRSRLKRRRRSPKSLSPIASCVAPAWTSRCAPTAAKAICAKPIDASSPTEASRPNEPSSPNPVPRKTAPRGTAGLCPNSE